MLVQDGRSSYHALQTATKRSSNTGRARHTTRSRGCGTHFRWRLPVSTRRRSRRRRISAENGRHRGPRHAPCSTDLGGRLRLQVSGVFYRYRRARHDDLRHRRAQHRRRRRRVVQPPPRADGSIVPRNSFVQPVRRKADLRLQQRISLPHRVALEGLRSSSTCSTRRTGRSRQSRRVRSTCRRLRDRTVRHRSASESHSNQAPTFNLQLPRSLLPRG
jgi:hypothetical protein